MDTTGISLDPESKAALVRLSNKAKRAAKETKIAGRGRASGFSSAIIRWFLKNHEDDLAERLDSEGITVLM